MNCAVCECDFKLTQSEKKRERIYHSDDPKTGKPRYMCDGCYSERINSEFRIIDGVSLCANSGCARNAMALSKYCEICEQSKQYE